VGSPGVVGGGEVPEMEGRCPVCGREDHEMCGPALWEATRARFLRKPADQAREVRAVDSEGSPAGILLPPEACDARAPLSDLDRVNIKTVLSSIDRPYPQLRRPMPLGEVIGVATVLWKAEVEGSSPTAAFANLAEAVRAMSQGAMEKTASLGSSMVKWGQDMLNTASMRMSTGGSCKAGTGMSSPESSPHAGGVAVSSSETSPSSAAGGFQARLAICSGG